MKTRLEQAQETHRRFLDELRRVAAAGLGARAPAPQSWPFRATLAGVTIETHATWCAVEKGRLASAPDMPAAMSHDVAARFGRCTCHLQPLQGGKT